MSPTVAASSASRMTLQPKSAAYRIPASDPPAIRPELNSVPELISDSCFSPVWRSTNHRTSPPAKIGAVVAMGR